MVVGVVGQVGDAVGIGLDVVEFYFWAFAHAELPMVFVSLLFFLDNACFGGGVVDIAVIDFGVTGGPAVGP